ncbi:MAG: hypothetical protein AAF533_20550 [Acidobacteriota bacterium]
MSEAGLTRSTTLLLAGFLLLHCNPPPGPSTIEYRLSWSWGEAREIPGGFEVTNDLGQVVRVHRGWLVNLSAEVVPCDEDGRPDEKARLASFSIPVAQAGHPGFGPTAVHAPQAESLAPPVSSSWQEVTSEPDDFCNLHYLVARANRRTLGLPDDEPDVDRISLLLEGEWSLGDEGTPNPFLIWTRSAHGKLEPRELRLEKDMVFTVTRELDSLFDGADFTTMNDEQLARRVLQNVVENTRLDLVEAPEGAR